MPQPIVLQDQSGLAQGIQNVGSVLGQALQQRNLRQEQQRQQSALAQALDQGVQGLGPNPTPMQYINFLSNMTKAGVPPEYLKIYQQAFLPQIKAQTEDQVGNMFLQRLGLLPPPQDSQRSMFQPMEVEEQIDISTMTPEQPVIEGAPVKRGEVAPAQNPLSQLSDSQLAAMKGSGIKRVENLADFELKRRETERKDFRSDRDFAYKRAGKFLEKIDEERSNIANQDEALRMMENAITEGDLSFFSKDNFAKFLGKYGEGLRTAKGAQLLSNQKEFLVSNIGRVGSRPNQWIEQQISDALAKIGRSREANLTVIEALKARINRDKKRIELTDELEEKYLKENGYVPSNIAAIVDKAMKPYEEEISNKLSYKVRQLYEKENARSLNKLSEKKVPQGTPLTAEMLSIFLDKYDNDTKKVRENAKKLGYTIPSAEEYQRYING